MKIQINKRNIAKILITIISILFVFLLILSGILKETVTDLDELWNYNTARAISMGLIPYKDISMITTPFLPTLVAIILRITTNELVISRILTAILGTGIIFITYKIMYEVTKKKSLSVALSGTIIYAYYNFFALDYNFFVLLISLIIEYIEIKEYRKKREKNEKILLIDNKKINLLIGLLAGLAICTKQTIGCFIALDTVLIQLLLVTKKEDFKVYFKNLKYRIIGILIPVIIFMLFLAITKSFKDFIDYAILGIKTFSNSIPYNLLFENKYIWIRCLAKFLPIFLIIMIIVELISKMKFKNAIIQQIAKNISQNKEVSILIASSLPMLITMYPIADTVHFLIATLPLIIALLCVFANIIILIYDKTKFKFKIFVVTPIIAYSILITTFYFGKITYYNFKDYKESEKNIKIVHYQHLNVPKYMVERIENIDALINEKESEGIKVYIADSEAVAYMIPTDKYNKNYDMFLKGNIGANGEEGIIENIKNSSNCIYLIRKDGLSLNWQSPTKAIEYIRNNLEKIESVSTYDAYYKM